MSPVDIAELAREHAERLREDIEKCTTREDHIRVTARANEALALLSSLNQMFDASVLDEESSSSN